jgi:hypothetical protein
MSPPTRHVVGMASASIVPVVLMWCIAALFTAKPLQSILDFPFAGMWLLSISIVWVAVVGIPIAVILIRSRRTSIWHFALAGFMGGALPSGLSLLTAQQYPPFDGSARSWLHVA